jgi:hypothetical protein
MFFCPNCDNLYVIVKDQSTGISSETPTTVSSDTETKDDKKLSNKGNVIYKCANCGFSQQIEPGTQILSRASDKIATEYLDQTKYKDMIYDNTLPLTRKYICPNKTCESHTDNSKKEAAWFKPSLHSYGIKYICKTCKVVW